MSNASPSPMETVLVVDDDRYGLTFLRSSLRLAGYQTVTAQEAGSARAILQREGGEAFSALLTDYRMPHENGLSLLRWAREFDPSLGAVIITAEGEKEIVKEALDAGAVGFLEKPATHGMLVDALAKAVAHTRRERRLHLQERELAEAGRLDEFLNAQMPADLEPHFRLYYKPVRDIGGDFLTARKVDSSRVVILAGDVSGHDVTAGYVSSYFQGLTRSGLESGRSLRDSLHLFNRILAREWAPAMAKRGQLPTSLAVNAIEIDLAARVWSVTVAGSPPPVLVDRNGFSTRLESGGPPLGWLEELSAGESVGSLDDVAAILLYTDGLHDWAEELGIDRLSLAYRLLHAERLTEDLPMPTQDDVFLTRFQPDTEMATDALFQPLIQETYAGDEVEDIDQMEAIWRRSLVFAFGDELEDRVFDLVICLREAVLNALEHGCERSASKVATLDVSFRVSDRRVRVRIDDPGKGHRFNLEERLKKLPDGTGRQLGLGMIQHLSDELLVDNGGASLVFDFLLNPKEG